MRFVPVLLACLTLVAPGRAAADDRAVQTPYGRLTIREADDMRCVFAGDRQVHCTQDDLLTFEGAPIVLKDYAVVLIGETCAGTACWLPEPNHFIVLTAEGARFQKTPFDAFWSETQPQMTGPNAFTMALPYFDGKLRSMRFADGQFSFEEKVAEGPTALSETDCGELFEQVLGECRAFEQACAGAFDGMSEFARRITESARLFYARFRMAELGRQCQRACTNKRLPDRAEFNATVCQRPG